VGYKWTVLVGRERMEEGVMATTVPMKGGTGRFAVDKCLDFVDENGDSENHILVKSDQEASITYMADELVQLRPEGKTVKEESPKRSSGSNGIIERQVQEVEGQIRVCFLGLQERLGVKVDARELIVAFIPEYAAYLINRFKTGSDGKVSYERVRGKKPTVLGLEFGEKVLYKLKPGAKMEKINSRWDFGIFIGVRRRSNEVMLSTVGGIEYARSVRRLTAERRWGPDCLTWVKWAPWHKYPAPTSSPPSTS
jgi:hypothetical protein